MEKEIKKANIPTVDTGENPEVPFPRDMIDLEVICYLGLLLKEVGGQNVSQVVHDATIGQEIHPHVSVSGPDSNANAINHSGERNCIALENSTRKNTSKHFLYCLNNFSNSITQYNHSYCILLLLLRNRIL